jgi:uncharacterized delta-60 repeat protein
MAESARDTGVALHASGSGRRSCPLLLLAAITLISVVAATACGGGGRVGGGSARGFGIRGKVRTDFGGDDVANALAIQRDGRIVVAGRTGPAFAVARYTQDGRLDPTFGDGGKVVTDFGAPPQKCEGPDPGDMTCTPEPRGAAALAIQGDDKIVVAGGRGSDFALARYRPGGRLDSTFGSGGKVVTDVGARPGRWDQAQRGANAIAIQPDGKILAAGAGPRDFALVRYTRDGRLDRSFASGGEVVTDFSLVNPPPPSSGGKPDDYAQAVAVQADGKIIAAGASGNGGYAYALARYLPDGRLDPTFGRGGEVVGSFGGDDASVVEALALQPDGKIVAAGSLGPRFLHNGLVRYTPAGRLDPSFYGGGRRGLAADGDATGSSAVVLKRDGRIIVAGIDNYAVDCCGARMADNLALIRYRRDGGLDSSFGKHGTALTRFELGVQVNAAAIEGKGEIVVAGGIARSRGSDFLLVRYKPDGELDR